MGDTAATTFREIPHSCVTAVACAAIDTNRVFIYAGTARGVAWSTDLGQTWQAPSLSGEIPAVVTAIAASPRFSQDTTVYVGTMEGCFRSRDGGVKFEHILAGGGVQCLEAMSQGTDPRSEPSDPIVLAGTVSDGILRSTDGGDSWHSANVGLFDLGVLDISSSPEVAPDRAVFLATGSGLYRSRNGGRAWRQPDASPSVGIQCVACSATDLAQEIVYLGTEEGDLHRSADGGETWERGVALDSQSINAICATTGSPERILAGTEAGVWISIDRGTTWKRSGADFGVILSLAAANFADRCLFVAGTWDRGIHASLDNGRHWRALNLLPATLR